MAVNFRTLLMWTIGSVVAVFVGELMTAEIRNLSAYQMVYLYGMMGSALFILVSLIMASTIVSSVNEKRKRQAFLMMPSTNLEKFLSLLVYTSVICVACVLLAFVLGDCLRMAWFKMQSYFVEYQVQVSVSDPAETYHGWSSALPKLIENLTPNVLDPDSYRRTWFYNAMNVFVIFAIAVWNLSLMTICGTLLRKYAFVVASLIIILCSILLSWTIHHFGLFLFWGDVWKDGVHYESEVGALAYVLAVLLPALAVFNYWASFHIFKHFELITNKWTNYDIFKR
jgi:hypothetical protein